MEGIRAAMLYCCCLFRLCVSQGWSVFDSPALSVIQRHMFCHPQSRMCQLPLPGNLARQAAQPHQQLQKHRLGTRWKTCWSPLPAQHPPSLPSQVITLFRTSQNLMLKLSKVMPSEGDLFRTSQNLMLKLSKVMKRPCEVAPRAVQCRGTTPSA